MLTFPNIDPVAFSLGPVAVHWYGLAYVAGFLGGIFYLKKLIRRWPATLTIEDVDNLFTWVVLGVILGGRLGYCFFYNPSYFMANPVDIFKVWQGGMSYHGGLLGVLLAVFLYARKHQHHFFDITDRLAPTVCIGLFFGRIANFINGELYGRVTDSPLGMVFPHAGAAPRHPSQLYEAFLEGIVLFAVLHWISYRDPNRFALSGWFAFLYGTFRFFVEFVRQPDDLAHLETGIFSYISMGQLLSIPLIIIGLLLLVKAKQLNKKPA